jgi:hypothetical protein
MHIHLCDVYGSAMVDRHTIVCWVKRVTASDTGKAELPDFPAQAVLSQLLALKSCSVLMHQPDKWDSVFQSPKDVLVTSLKILDIWRCAWDGFLRSSQSNRKLKGKPALPSCWQVLQLRMKPSYLWLLLQMKPGSIILNRRLKGNPWCSTILNPLPPPKKINNFLSFGKVMIAVFWHSERVIPVNVMPWGETVNSDANISMLKGLQKHYNELGLTRTQ